MPSDGLFIARLYITFIPNRYVALITACSGDLPGSSPGGMTKQFTIGDFRFQIWEWIIK